MRHLAGVVGLVLLLAACKGDQGAKGDKGDTGDPGAMGQQGQQGQQGVPGEAILLSERARHGLTISPVPVDLAGLNGDQIEQVGMGSYLVNAIGDCQGCHLNAQPQGPPRFLAGGTAFPAGGTPGNVVYSRNLTPHPDHGLKLTEAQFIEAIRTGKDFSHEGNSLQVMPWFNLRWVSDADLKAIYAYLKKIPAVDNQVPAPIKDVIAPIPMPAMFNEGTDPSTVRALPPAGTPDPGNVLRGMAIQPLPTPIAFDLLPAESQAAFGRGSYIVNSLGGCNDCHTNPFRDLNPASQNFLKVNTDVYLTGGTVFAVPPGLNAMLGQTRTMAENLVGLSNGFFSQPSTNFFTFLSTIQTGQHQDRGPSKPMLGWPMPWQVDRFMLIEDLVAVYTYLNNVQQATGSFDKATQRIARYCTQNSDCNTGGGETCNVATNECIGGACQSNAECGACQTCVGGPPGTCAAPADQSPCLTMGL